jgi:thymidylate synthase (FAD)
MYDKIIKNRLGDIMQTQLKVELLRYTPEPEKTVAAAAKLCYSQSGASQLDEGLTETEIEKFLKILMNMGHYSPIEHVTFTFAIEGVSRALSHQLVRHRLASFSQQSQRYVSENNFQYIIPPSVAKSQKANEIFLETMDYINNSYCKIRKLIQEEFTNELKKQGMSEKKAVNAAEKLANEDARFVLPNACETKIVVTMNARELRHFFSQRCCERAQWEIRELAYQMLCLVKPIAPLLFTDAGPNCLHGDCPEGSMTCGKAAQVREKYNNI